MSLLSDAPTRSDAIGVQSLAVALGNLLKSGVETPLVIGVHGEWGSGKTSFLNMVEMYLNPLSAFIDPAPGKQVHPASSVTPRVHDSLLFQLFPYAEDRAQIVSNHREFLESYAAWSDEGFSPDKPSLSERYRIAKARFYEMYLQAGQFNIDTIWFNAWQFDDDLLVWQGLLHTVNEHLSKSPNYPIDSGFAQRLAKVLRRSAGQGLRIVTAALTSGAVTETGAEALIEETKNRFEIRDELGKMVVDTVTKAGSTTKNPMNLAILIDDLDRCSPATVINLLESLKLFFDIEGCVFLIAASESVIASGIEAKGVDLGYGSYFQGQGNKYLEKIIQLPLRLPPLQLEQILSYIDALDIRGEIKGLMNTFADHLSPNPRRLKRIVNTLLFLQQYADVSASSDTVARFDLRSAAWLVIIQFEWPHLYDSLVKYGYSFYEALMDLSLGKWAIVNELLDTETQLLSADRWEDTPSSSRRDLLLESPQVQSAFQEQTVRKLVWECYQDSRLWKFLTATTHLSDQQLSSALSFTRAITSPVVDD